MIRIDGFYLIELGNRLAGIQNIRIFSIENGAIDNARDVASALYPAAFALDEFMSRSVYRFRRLTKPANDLQAAIKSAIENCRSLEPDEHPSTDILFELQEVDREFQAVLKAEMGAADMFLVQQKGAFDTPTLIDHGVSAFPIELPEKCPEAEFDANSAMRALAFELPTAAAFHFFRLIEIVLGRYFDEQSGGEQRPQNKSVGSYIQKFEKFKNPDEKLLSSLRDLKDLYRNPTIHPEDRISSVEDAINLFGLVRAVIAHLLHQLPAIEEDQHG